MKIRLSIFLTFVVFLACLSGCDREERPGQPDSMIGVYSITAAGRGPEETETFTDQIVDGQEDIMTGTWNIDTGEIFYEEMPAFTLWSGSGTGPMDVWDGEHRVVADRYFNETIIQQNEAFDLKVLPERPESPLYGLDYEFAVSNGSASLILDTGEVYAFRDIGGPMLSDGQATLESLSSFPLVGCYKDGVFTAVYSHIDSENMHDSVIVAIRFDTKTQTMEYAEPVKVPSECIHGVYRFGEGYIIAEDKLYFPGELALGMLNLETGEAHALMNVMDQLDSLIPNSDRDAKYGMYTKVEGCNGDVVVAGVGYRGADDEFYWIDYALRGEELVGGLYRTDLPDGKHAITTFDKNLQIKHVYDSETVGFWLDGVYFELHDAWSF